MENGSKTQFVATLAANTRKLALAGADANQISKEFEILGVQAAMQPRQVKKKEIQRLDVALVCVKRLSCLKLGFAKFHRALCPLEMCLRLAQSYSHSCYLQKVVGSAETGPEVPFRG